MKLFLAAIVTLALTACATAPQSPTASATTAVSASSAPNNIGPKADVVAKLQNASTIAVAGNDPKG